MDLKPVKGSLTEVRKTCGVKECKKCASGEKQESIKKAMSPAERKIQQLEQQLSRIKNEKSLYYCIAQAAEQREAQATASANELRNQLLKERALRAEAAYRLQEEMRHSFNLKKNIENLSPKEQTFRDGESRLFQWTESPDIPKVCVHVKS